MLVQLSDEFYPLLSAHGNTIKLLADEELNVYADPVRLARVFNNILKNAISYSYPNTEIKVNSKKRTRTYYHKISKSRKNYSTSKAGGFI